MTAEDTLDETMKFSSGNQLDEIQRHFVLQAMKSYAKEKCAEKWISVKDRLPEKEGEYLVCYGNTVMTMGFLENKWYSEIYGEFVTYQNKITHWMELPDEPKFD